MEDGRAPRVKNKAAAPIQITAEQLLREAQERQEGAFKAPRQRLESYEELDEYRGRKRKEYEERVRRTRGSLKEWQQYANWEASQGEFDRSRSIFERALDVDPRATSLWLSYTEMELKNRNVQHARNLFDRAVTLLPRVDTFWYKYVYLEELLQNVPGARQVFERWMKWEPDDKAWQAYIKMEERYGENDRASSIHERWVAVRPEPRVWVKWAKFEEERARMDKAREVFQTALEFFGDEEEEQIEKAQAVYAAFAKMETRAKEFERARVVFKFALDRLPRSKSSTLYAAYTKFEKQHGTRSTVEVTIVGKRRIQYEDEVSQNPNNYDTWFDYARLEEGALRMLREEGEDAGVDGEEAAINRIREVYERAVAQTPPSAEKRHWRRYIFLWLDYALFEEIETKDFARAREIYKTALRVVPNKQFTFTKVWVQFAYFELRRLDLVGARKILGTAIGMCPKESLFKKYIQMEIDLREFDRARRLYEKYIEYDSTSPTPWISYASLEQLLADSSRARGIYELGVGQNALSTPELLWKSYIDFEVGEIDPDAPDDGDDDEDDSGCRRRVRRLYERLVNQSGHWKVWIAWALFEGTEVRVGEEEEDEEDDEGDEGGGGVKIVPGNPAKAREIFKKGYEELKVRGEIESRVELLRTWKEYEETHGNEAGLKTVEGMMPWQVTSYGQKNDDGEHETFKTWVFPDDQREQSSVSKFLANAHKWKQTLAQRQAEKAGPPGSGDEVTAPAVEKMAVDGDADQDEDASSGGE